MFKLFFFLNEKEHMKKNQHRKTRKTRINGRINDLFVYTKLYVVILLSTYTQISISLWRRKKKIAFNMKMKCVVVDGCALEMHTTHLSCKMIECVQERIKRENQNTKEMLKMRQTRVSFKCA